MELMTVKIIVLAISGLVRVFFGVIPLVVIKVLAKSKWTKQTDKWMKKVISVLMFFGGGVLLATCFLHMMPEVRDSFREAEPDLELPLSEIIFLGGFFLVYMIEDIVHSIIHQRRSRKDANKSNNNININAKQNPSSFAASVKEDKRLHNHDEAIITGNNLHSLSNSTVENERGIGPNHLRGTREIFPKNGFKKDEVPGLCREGLGGINNDAFVSEKFQYCDPDLKDMVNNGTSEFGLPRGRLSICSELICANNIAENKSDLQANVYNNHYHHHHNRNSENNLKTENNNSASMPTRRSKARHNHNRGNHSHIPVPGDDEMDQTIGAEIRNILIVIAISFHGIFEGMAIGLQGSERDVWYLFLAVSLHECTILFCIGVELISSKTKIFRMILYILVVALVSPLGIAIGIIISEKAYGEVIHQALIVGCFQGLAAGTLLYVTFFEIFQEEGKKLHRKCYHILIAVLGFVLMGSLEFMGAHEHGGHGSSSANNCSSADDSHAGSHNDHNHDDHGHSH